MSFPEQARITSEQVGIESLGDLGLYARWRPGKRLASEGGEWTESELHLPVTEFDVEPEDVLFWFNEPTRLNSLKRMAYMLGSRALPRMVMGGSGSDNLLQLVDEPIHLTRLGYTQSRQQMIAFTSWYLEQEWAWHVNHKRGANTRLVFRYTAPKNNIDRQALQTHLLSVERAA